MTMKLPEIFYPKRFTLPDSYNQSHTISFLPKNRDIGNSNEVNSEEYSLIIGFDSYSKHIFSGNGKYRNYTVDKTKILEILEINSNIANMFIAPRRFGKTFTASMICTFYDYYFSYYFKELFSGTYIQNRYPSGFSGVHWLQHCGKFFIFELSLRDLDSSTYESYEISLINRLFNGFVAFSKKYTEKDLILPFKTILENQYSSNKLQITNFFSVLITFFQYCFKTVLNFQLMIFIDECQDGYCWKDILQDIEDPRLKLFSEFLNSITKEFRQTPKPILLIVSLFPFPKAILDSRCELILRHEINSPVMSYFIGFLSKDVEKMFDDFHVSEHGRNLLRNQFNSYQFCAYYEFQDLGNQFTKPDDKFDENYVTIYNPWSLMISLKHGKVISAFSEVVFSICSIDSLLKHPDYMETISYLLSDHTNSIRIIDNPSFSNLDEFLCVSNRESLIKLLFISGYLCYNGRDIWIPNYEIKTYFMSIFRSHLLRMNIPTKFSKNSMKSLDYKNYFEFFQMILSELFDVVKPANLFNESFILCVLLTWFSSIESCKVFTQYSFSRSRKRNIASFADHVAIHPNGTAFVFAINDCTSKSRISTANDGYDHILRSHYYDFPGNDDVKEIVICSISMDSKRFYIVFSGPDGRDKFSSEPNCILTRNIDSTIPKINSFYTSFVENNTNDVFSTIDSSKRNSSIIIVDNLSNINQIENYSNWRKIHGSMSQNERAEIINGFPDKNPYLIVTFAVLRGLLRWINPETIFVLYPPEDQLDFLCSESLSVKQLVIFYSSSQIKSKEKVEDFLAEFR